MRTVRTTVTSAPWYVVLGAEDLRTAAEEATCAARAGKARPYVARRALSSVALLLMAFESWVNHELALRLLFGRDEAGAPDPHLEELLLRGGLAMKARQIPRYAGGRALAPNEHPELELLVLLRHELMHDLPASNVRGEINRLEPLEGLELLRTAPSGSVEYMHHERLASYDLAWWAWETVRDVADAVIAAKGIKGTHDGLHNFDLPVQWEVPSPETIATRAADAGHLPT